ncbi:MAG: Ig-like domain-containing protein [Bacteroidota bacterium]
MIKLLYPLIFSLLIALYVLSSCANQSSPSGGPKDTIPPILEESYPKEGQLNFQDQKIQLTFDEYVTLNNPKEEILITPTIEGEFEIDYKKDKVIIDFDTPLQDSTTYTINFREAIKDITEGNPADALQFAFSTGPFLDSLKISGRTYELLTGQPAGNLTVSLYNANDTLDVFNNPPIYLTKTQQDGTFAFQNLKAGDYYLYAILDKNKNSLLEPKSEDYGFFPQPIILDTNVVDLDIPIQHLDIRPFELQSARQQGQYYLLKFNKYVIDYTLDALDSTLSIYSTISDNHNDVKIYNTFPKLDSTLISLKAYDTLFNELDTSFYIGFSESQRKYDEFSFKLQGEAVDKKQPIAQVEFNFTKPVESVNIDSLYIQLDSTTIFSLDPLTDFQWNQNRTILNLTHSLTRDSLIIIAQDSTDSTSVAPDPNTPSLFNSPSEASTQMRPIKLYLGTGAFMSVEQDTSTTKEQVLNYLQPAQLGSIQIEISTEEPSFIVQLLDNSGNIIEELKNPRTINISNLQPKDYRLRILVDSDSNGTWNPGDIYNFKAPEPVIFYQDEDGNEKLIIRANWEVLADPFSF